jgi:hypothetical protein
VAKGGGLGILPKRLTPSVFNQFAEVTGDSGTLFRVQKTNKAIPAPLTLQIVSFDSGSH